MCFYFDLFCLLQEAVASFAGAPAHVKKNDAMRFALFDTHFRMERFEQAATEAREVLALDLDKVQIELTSDCLNCCLNLNGLACVLCICVLLFIFTISLFFVQDYRAHGLRLQVLSQLYTSSTPPLAELRATLAEGLSLASEKSSDRQAVVAAQVKKERLC